MNDEEHVRLATQEIQRLHADADKALVKLLDLQPIIPYDCQWELDRDAALRAWVLYHGPAADFYDTQELLALDMQGYSFYITNSMLNRLGVAEVRARLKEWHRIFHAVGPQVARNSLTTVYA